MNIMEETDDKFDFALYINHLGLLIKECEQSSEQIGHTISTLSSGEMVGEAITYHLIEFIPDIQAQRIPIVNESDSENVYAIAPKGERAIVALLNMLQSPRFAPQTHLPQHMAEVSARLKLLREAQKETLRSLVINRFRISDSFHQGVHEQSANRAMSLAIQTREYGAMAIQSAKVLFADLKIISPV